MGISPSRRVSGSLQNSGEFNSACKSVFDQLSSLNHHHSTDAVVLPYQLLDASNHLHLSLSASNPLVKKWVPDPPPRDQVDRVYRSISTRRQPKDADNNDGSPASLRLEQFKSFAVELFASAVVGNAARAVATRVPIGAVGIVGVGVATRSGRRDLIGVATGAYALGVATSIYISLL